MSYYNNANEQLNNIEKQIKLTEELNQIKDRELVIRQQLKQLAEEQKNRQKQIDLEEGKTRWQIYEAADPQEKKMMYNECLQKFCRHMCSKHRHGDGEIKYGHKWDILPCNYKVLKMNGDVYWTGKHPKGNIIKFPFEWQG